MSTITVKNLTKSYGKQQVLKGVDFTVEEGKIFALLGSNGAGKTTTINILTTLIPADGGEADVAGFSVATEAQKIRKALSLTGQFAAVDDMLSARENLQLICDLRHVKNAGSVAAKLLEDFGLTDAADRRVATFSGGMRRRLDIAMSLVGSPKIIFLDEPTTGLDPEARNEMWRTIRKLANSGTTILLTTQYLDEADELADRIAVLDGGKIVANGTASELKKLVPAGVVEMTFADDLVAQKAANALAEFAPKQDGLKLTVTGDGSVKGLANLFRKMEAAGCEPTEFSQKQPTLDDVFFKLTGRQKSNPSDKKVEK
jgi:ABC-2 type transport system ATP-binding protein